MIKSFYLIFFFSPITIPIGSGCSIICNGGGYIIYELKVYNYFREALYLCASLFILKESLFKKEYFTGFT